MSGPPAPAPSAPQAAYQPTPTYTSGSGASAPAPAKIPGWISLGQIITGVGAILILIGFFFGWAATGSFNSAYSCTTPACTTGDLQNFASSLGIFFFLTGLGVFLAIGGWLTDIIWPKYKARPRPVPTYTAPVAPPAPAPVPASTTAPAAPPPGPACPNCGKPTTYIAQYGRYYCYSCGRYV